MNVKLNINGLNLSTEEIELKSLEYEKKEVNVILTPSDENITVLSGVLDDMSKLKIQRKKQEVAKDYTKIVELRNYHLSKSKEDCDYHFTVAHGLTEAIKVLSGAVTVTILPKEKED